MAPTVSTVRSGRLWTSPRYLTALALYLVVAGLDFVVVCISDLVSTQAQPWIAVDDAAAEGLLLLAGGALTLLRRPWCWWVVVLTCLAAMASALLLGTPGFLVALGTASAYALPSSRDRFLGHGTSTPDVGAS